MTQKNITITVEGREVTITQIEDKDYISLSDMAREDGGIERIRNWMRNRDTIEFLTTWEQIHNPGFNMVQMHHITKDIGLNRFIMSPQKWAEETNAIGILSKAGRYGGVYGHKDIAYHFGMWLSPRFSLLLITEFDRLKREEFSQWRESNPEPAKTGNMRDFADILQLNVLANLESLNSVLIEKGVSKEKRFELLADTAISQYKRLAEQDNLKRLE